MGKVQYAELKYEYKGLSPHEISMKLGRYTSSNRAGSIEDGRPKARLPSAHYLPAETTKFKAQVKAYLNGDNNEVTLRFPLRYGLVTYINTLPTSTHLNLMFRHDACVASNYDGEGRETGTHYQPQVYFMVKVSMDTGKKEFVIINSPFIINGRVFPHNDRHNEGMFSGCCDGDYSRQLVKSLDTNDLSVFLSVMSIYLKDGTRSTDQYGESCRYFRSDKQYDRVNFHINDALEASVAGYVFSDHDIPHKQRLSEERMGLTFTNPSVHMTYIETMCSLHKDKTDD